MKWIKILIAFLLSVIVLLLLFCVIFTKVNNLKFQETISIIKIILSNTDKQKITDEGYILYISDEFQDEYNRYLKVKLDELMDNYIFEKQEGSAYFYSNSKEKIIIETKQLIGTKYIKIKINKKPI